MISVTDAKDRLDSLMTKARVDFYKPIQIAEVLYRSRTVGDFDISNVDTFQNPSKHWRDLVTFRLANKKSTSSARYQHDVWNITAMPVNILAVLDEENKRTNGAVERYVYMRYAERQDAVASMVALLSGAYCWPRLNRQFYKCVGWS